MVAFFDIHEGPEEDQSSAHQRNYEIAQQQTSDLYEQGQLDPEMQRLYSDPANWQRLLDSPMYRGDRERLLADVGKYAAQTAISPFPVAGPENQFTAEDVWKFFDQPRESAARQAFQGDVSRGYGRALRGASRRMARNQRKLPGGAMAEARIQGGINRPEGAAASARRADILGGYEQMLAANPNRFASVTNINNLMQDAFQRNQRLLTAGDFFIDLGQMAAEQFAPEGVSELVAMGGELASFGGREQQAKTQRRMGELSPGAFQPSGATYRAPTAAPTTIDPYASFNEGALRNLYGRPTGQQEEEDDYLFGSGLT